jgi:hypothetical protein
MNFKKLEKYELIWLFSFAINIIAFFWLFFKINPGNKTLALHFNVIVGADLYGNGKNLYFVPLSGFIINLVNFTLYSKFKNSEIFYRHLFSFTSLFVQCILLSAILLLSKIN